MGDAILCIPRDARVRAYRTRDTHDGVVPATSKRQQYCHSSYIELSGHVKPAPFSRRDVTLGDVDGSLFHNKI